MPDAERFHHDNFGIEDALQCHPALVDEEGIFQKIPNPNRVFVVT
jgi:hypothetical protein